MKGNDMMRRIVAAALLTGTASIAAAQLFPSVGGALPPVLPGVVGNATGPLGSPTAPAFRQIDTLADVGMSVAQPANALVDQRRERLRSLIREFPRDLASDGDGNPVRRGELLLLDADAATLAAANRAGFGVLRTSRDAALDLVTTVLSAPRGLDTDDAVKRLRKLAPAASVDFNHILEPAGAALAAAGAPVISQAGVSGATLAMIDGGVAGHPALRGARIEQRGFAGAVKATGHGTAIASLLVGREGAFHGAALGASLLVADVYGGNRAAGSAEAIVHALSWVTERRPRVVTISLVGPPNALIARGIKAVQARGITIVAAVGNDGPAAPPQYPASYPGVIAITGVDAKDRALVEAGKPVHLDFAAPGADLAAALPGQGYVRVRGTSFAAPLAAARVAAGGVLDREATPGKGRVGRGILCRDCRIDPKSVGLR